MPSTAASRRVRPLHPLVALLLLGAAPVAAKPSDGDAMRISSPGHQAQVTAAALGRLPVEDLAVTFLTEHGTRQGRFSGPLLWSVLEQSGLLAQDGPKAQERQALAVRGADGCQVLLALAELSPEFEGKHVILATGQDGHPLGAGHWRLVVPGDRRGGRSVHDVASIALLSPLR